MNKVKIITLGILSHIIAIVVVGGVVWFIWNLGANVLLSNVVPKISIQSSMAVSLFLYFIHILVNIYMSRIFDYKLRKIEIKEAIKQDAQMRMKLIEKDLDGLFGTLEASEPQHEQ